MSSVQGATAKVELRDGRDLKVHVAVSPARPQISLLSKGSQDDADGAAATSPAPVQFGSQDDLPVEKKLMFFLKSKAPVSFPRDEKIEVAAVDGSFHTALSLSDGSLLLEDANTALGVVQPLARFGPSAFGPVEARPVSADGVTGDWLPLGTLVRLPGFKELRCPHAVAEALHPHRQQSFSSPPRSPPTPAFDDPTNVPPGLLLEPSLSFPILPGGALYLKLRDDPSTVQTLTLPVLPAVTARSIEPPAETPVEPGQRQPMPGRAGHALNRRRRRQPRQPALQHRPLIADPFGDLHSISVLNCTRKIATVRSQNFSAPTGIKSWGNRSYDYRGYRTSTLLTYECEAEFFLPRPKQ